MRTSDDKQKTDATTSTTTTSVSSSSMSCVVENENKLIDNETVMVNNCVNIDSDSANESTNINTEFDDDSLNEKSINELGLTAEKLLVIDSQHGEQNNFPLPSTSYASQIAFDCKNSEKSCGSNDITEDAKQTMIENDFNIKNDDDIKNYIVKNDDDDTLTSSKYSDVSSRCEIMLQPSSSTSALLVSHSHAAHYNHYTPIIKSNRNYRKAVRKNFSLWIGVTSCVWACLVWLVKKYTN